MANNSKFNRQEAIHAAMALYWEKGFHATSMRNLQDTIDMRPGSIYAQFGSKEGLFKEAIKHYLTMSLTQLANSVDTSVSKVEGLKSFIKTAVTRNESAPSNMCMLVKTISELTQDNSALLSAAKQALNTVEKEFSNLIAQAQEEGELDKSVDPTRLAKILQINIMGMRMYIQANDCNSAEMITLVDDIFDSAPWKM